MTANTPATTTLEQMRNPGARGQAQDVVTMGFGTSQSFELMQRGAKLLTASDLVPQQFRGNLANCVIALNMANRLGADPLMVMQNLYVVHGTPSWSSKFLIATVNTCGRFSAMRYEWRGESGEDKYGCRAWAIEKATGERLDGIWIDWAMVKAEGWSKKSGSKWLTMADQMFVYRAAAFWQRAYAPELGMGLSSQEELADIVDVHPDGRVSVSTTVEELRTARAPAAEVVTPEPSPSAAEPKPQPDDGRGDQIDELFVAKEIRDDLTRAQTAEQIDFARGGIANIADETVKAELLALASERMRAIAQTEDRPAAQPTPTRRPRAPISAE